MAESADDAVKALRIIIGGLVMGLGLLAGIGLLMAPILNPPDPQLGSLLLAVLGVMALGSAAGYFVLRQAMLRDLAARAAELRQSADPASLIVLRYRQFAIAGAGLIDGPGMVAGLTYLMTANPIALAAMAAVVLSLLVHLPSADRIRRLAESAAMGSVE